MIFPSFGFYNSFLLVFCVPRKEHRSSFLWFPSSVWFPIFFTSWYTEKTAILYGTWLWTDNNAHGWKSWDQPVPTWCPWGLKGVTFSEILQSIYSITINYLYPAGLFSWISDWHLKLSMSKVNSTFIPLKLSFHLFWGSGNNFYQVTWKPSLTCLLSSCFQSKYF